VRADLPRRPRSLLASDRRHHVDGAGRATASETVAGVGGSGWTEVQLRSDEHERHGRRAVDVELGKPARQHAVQRRRANDRETDDDDVSAWVRDEAHPIELRL